MNFRYFSYSRCYPNGQYFIMTSESKWPTHHFEVEQLPPAGLLNFETIESKLILPCMDMGQMCGLNNQYLADSFQNYNIQKPVMFNIKTDDYLDSYFLDLAHTDAYDLYINQTDALIDFFDVFQQQFEPLIQKADKNILSLDLAMFDGREIYVPIEENPLAFDIKNLKLTPLLPDKIDTVKIHPLSGREIDCLHLLSQGYRLKAVAQYMEISPRTVETYIKRIRSKTKLYSREQLVDFYRSLA